MTVFTVTTTADVVDPGDGQTSLREAVAAANASGGDDRIEFAPGLAGQSVILSAGVLAITSGGILTIDGDIDDDGTRDITIDANNTSTIFTVSASSIVTLDGLHIREGRGELADGTAVGAIYNAGALTIANSYLALNSAYAALPGALAGSIVNAGSATIVNSQIFYGVIAGATGANGTSGSVGSDGSAGGSAAQILNLGGGIISLSNVQAGYVAIYGGIGGNGGDGFTGAGGHGGQGGSAANIVNFGSISGSFTTLGALAPSLAGLGGFAGDGSPNGLPGANGHLMLGALTIGTSGNDVHLGITGVESVYGGGGDDTLQGSEGNGVPDDGVDRIFGEDGNDVLTGDNADQVYGGEGDDTIFDIYVFGDGVFDGGNGVDTIDFSRDPQGMTDTYDLTLPGGFSTSFGGTFVNFENVVGSILSETIIGNAAANRLDGYKGDDTVSGGDGFDSLFGGDGADSLAGGNDHDELTGGAGNDVLTGDAGDDILAGGAGRDTITGGAGADYVSFASAADSRGATRDMVVGMDFENADAFELGLRVTEFVAPVSAQLRSGSFNADLTAALAGAFTAGGGAQAVLFDPTGGNLDIQGHRYLIVDADDNGAYSSAADYVIQLVDSVNLDKLGAEDFIQLVDDYTALTNGNSTWNGYGHVGQSAIVTYSFEEVYPVDTPNPPEIIATFRPLSETERTNARAAAQAWDDASGLIFIEVAPGQGDMRIWAMEVDPNNVGVGAYNSFPNIYLDPDFAASEPGNGDGVYNYEIDSDIGYFLHEMGHGIGLSHATDGFYRWRPSMLQSDGYSVMYGRANFLPGLGPEDFIAAQVLYGQDSADGSHVAFWSYNAAAQTLLQEGLETADALRGNFGKDLMRGKGGADLLFGDHADDTIEGGDGNDTMWGGRGDDSLVGGAGIDRLYGGFGNDVYVNAAGDTVIEYAGEGDADVVYSNATITLATEVERLILTGGSAIDGAGNYSDNQITGNGRANRLDGNAGRDTLIGGEGNDTLDGGAGLDSMEGGAGNDTFVVDAKKDRTVEAADQGTDTVISSVNRALGANLENLTLTGTAVIGNGNALPNVLTGNGMNNALRGYDGDDTLVGGGGDDELRGAAGGDSMAGGDGSDRYYVDSALDKVRETNPDKATGGNDTVFSQIGYTLGANVENIRLQGVQAIGATGNELDNTLLGNSAANLIQGLSGNDRLFGKDGADTLAGGAGNDTLTGGANGDVFRFAATNAGADRITDFVRGNDRFQLSGGSFSKALIAGTDTILTHNGGTIRIEGVSTLSLAQWNALVIPGGESFGGSHEALGLAARLQDLHAHLGHTDWLLP
jgi:CSLREA domain-containing protein